MIFYGYEWLIIIILVIFRSSLLFLTGTMSTQKKIKDGGLPGQIYETPPTMDSCRLFYSSLYAQKGTASRMATEWLLLRGLLPEKLARKLNDGIWDVDSLCDSVSMIEFKPLRQKIYVKLGRFRPVKP